MHRGVVRCPKRRGMLTWRFSGPTRPRGAGVLFLLWLPSMFRPIQSGPWPGASMQTGQFSSFEGDDKDDTNKPGPGPEGHSRSMVGTCTVARPASSSSGRSRHGRRTETDGPGTWLLGELSKTPRRRRVAKMFNVEPDRGSRYFIPANRPLPDWFLPGTGDRLSESGPRRSGNEEDHILGDEAQQGPERLCPMVQCTVGIEPAAGRNKGGWRFPRSRTEGPSRNSPIREE